MASEMKIETISSNSNSLTFYGAMVEQRDGLSWLCDDDDDEQQWQY